MKHWTEFLPKQPHEIKIRREAIMQNNHAMHRLAGQIEHIQKETHKMNMELDRVAGTYFTDEEIEAACLKDTIIDIEIIKN